MGAQLAAWWAALWPNLLASALWALPGFTVHHILMRRQHQRTAEQQTRQIQDHITHTLGGRK